MSGFLYFIGTASKRVKIGWSRHPHKRLKQLQTGSGEPLALIASLPGARSLEGVFHDIFEPDRLGGEWFDNERGQISKAITAVIDGELATYLRKSASARLAHADALEAETRGAATA